MAFHLAIAHAAHNNPLANSVQLLRNLMRHWLFYKVLIPEVAPRILKRHTAIYRAIAQHKPLAARREMRLHLAEAMVLVERVIKQRKSERKPRTSALTSRRMSR
jgi:GntR family transcriptional repressor for pyruvate dehydrogenase complex